MVSVCSFTVSVGRTKASVTGYASGSGKEKRLIRTFPSFSLLLLILLLLLLLGRHGCEKRVSPCSSKIWSEIKSKIKSKSKSKSKSKIKIKSKKAYCVGAFGGVVG